MARDFKCDTRTIRTQFAQLKEAGLARRGRGPDSNGREVDGIWLADVPSTGRFDPVERIKSSGSNDPPPRIKRSTPADQTIREAGSNDPPIRIKPSAKPDQMIRPYKEDPTDPIKPDQTRSRAGAQELDLFGNPVNVDASGAVITAAEIRAWWETTYTPLRRDTRARWRPGSRVQDLPCNPKRIAAIRKLIADNWPGAEWSAVRDRLTHVVQAAAAKVATQRGERVPYKGGTYDTLRNADPDYWLKATNFDQLLAADVVEPESGKQADELEVIGGVVQYPRADGTDWGTGTAYGDPARRRHR
jgi:hypothetical protein